MALKLVLDFLALYSLEYQPAIPSDNPLSQGHNLEDSIALLIETNKVLEILF